jgi:hypothetical protein
MARERDEDKRQAMLAAAVYSLGGPGAVRVSRRARSGCRSAAEGI